MPTSGRLANFTQSQGSLPRTTKEKLVHCYMPIIEGGKFPSRTLKCDSRQSWAHKFKDSKSNLLVRVRERRAQREPSLIVGKGCISWLVVSLLALTRQKHLAKSSPQR
jgi:hypothetical protein